MKRNRQTVSAKRRRKSSAQYLAGGGQSQYARKAAYLHKHGLWGWEVKDKPWKKAKATQ